MFFPLTDKITGIYTGLMMMMTTSALAMSTSETMTVTMLMAMLTDRAAHSAALLIEQLSKSLPAASPLQLLISKCFRNGCFNQSSEDTG